ncbi:hypothetical protein LCGC14_1099260 [marine sediment metagenome]|uniref:Uncharacterized protein n=1 Tax=marine sediment metagenome TaxID=412755 RepID=A0A0F9QG70_9ZZZZ
MKVISRGQIRPQDEGGTIPMVIECDCGHKLELWASTNTCPCAKDYNRTGQRLAPLIPWDKVAEEVTP